MVAGFLLHFLFIHFRKRFAFSLLVSRPLEGGKAGKVTAERFLPAGEIRIAFVLYKHIGAYLSTDNASVKLGGEALAANYSVIVNSPVITAAINKDSNKVYLSDPVVFTIRHLQVKDSRFALMFVSAALILCRLRCVSASWITKLQKLSLSPTAV